MRKVLISLLIFVLPFFLLYLQNTEGVTSWCNVTNDSVTNRTFGFNSSLYPDPDVFDNVLEEPTFDYDVKYEVDTSIYFDADLEGLEYRYYYCNFDGTTNLTMT